MKKTKKGKARAPKRSLEWFSKEHVKVPREWRSHPDHPKTRLAYITDKEFALLKAKDMHNSGVDKNDHYGPGGVPSLNGAGDYNANTETNYNSGGSTTSSSYNGGGGGGADSGGQSTDRGAGTTTYSGGGGGYNWSGGGGRDTGSSTTSNNSGSGYNWSGGGGRDTGGGGNTYSSGGYNWSGGGGRDSGTYSPSGDKGAGVSRAIGSGSGGNGYNSTTGTKTSGSTSYNGGGGGGNDISRQAVNEQTSNVGGKGDRVSAPAAAAPATVERAPTAGVGGRAAMINRAPSMPTVEQSTAYDDPRRSQSAFQNPFTPTQGTVQMQQVGAPAQVQMARDAAAARQVSSVAYDPRLDAPLGDPRAPSWQAPAGPGVPDNRRQLGQTGRLNQSMANPFTPTYGNVQMQQIGSPAYNARMSGPVGGPTAEMPSPTRSIGPISPVSGRGQVPGVTYDPRLNMPLGDPRAPNWQAPGLETPDRRRQLGQIGRPNQSMANPSTPTYSNVLMQQVGAPGQRGIAAANNRDMPLADGPRDDRMPSFPTVAGDKQDIQRFGTQDWQRYAGPELAVASPIDRAAPSLTVAGGKQDVQRFGTQDWQRYAGPEPTVAPPVSRKTEQGRLVAGSDGVTHELSPEQAAYFEQSAAGRGSPKYTNAQTGYDPNGFVPGTSAVPVQTEKELGNVDPGNAEAVHSAINPQNVNFSVGREPTQITVTPGTKNDSPSQGDGSYGQGPSANPSQEGFGGWGNSVGTPRLQPINHGGENNNGVGKTTFQGKDTTPAPRPGPAAPTPVEDLTAAGIMPWDVPYYQRLEASYTRGGQEYSPAAFIDQYYKRGAINNPSQSRIPNRMIA